ncbi:hypothetical protein FQZ97_548850 [compost metagenome]
MPGLAAERTSTGRGKFMPKLGSVASVMKGGALYLPGVVSRAMSTSRYWPHWAGTVTSPTCSDGFTPPAMPLNTMPLMRKRLSTSCVFMVAFVMLMPERNSTTGLPSSVPVVNSTPFTLCLRGPCRRVSSSLSSGSKAEITARRGVSSSRVLLLMLTTSDL